MSQTKDIRTEVDDELSFDPLVDASDVTAASAPPAMGAAWMAPGVYDVNDDLDITG